MRAEYNATETCVKLQVNTLIYWVEAPTIALNRCDGDTAFT